jgi:hypothetical protein
MARKNAWSPPCRRSAQLVEITRPLRFLVLGVQVGVGEWRVSGLYAVEE